MQFRKLHEGMGEAVFQRTYGRKKDSGEFETWGEVAKRVALGNSLLCKDEEERRQERKILEKHLAKATVLLSGRHLQHGDADQPTRPMEVFTNCSTSASSFALFWLLMSGCFRKGTPVKMADGSYKDIDEVRVGDLVISYCQATGTFQKQKVLTTFVNKPKPMVKVTLSDDTSVVCTFDHLFLTSEGWVMAKDLKGKNIIQCPKEIQECLNQKSTEKLCQKLLQEENSQKKIIS